MKKQYFKHFKMQKTSLPKIQSRRVFGSSRDGSFMTAAYKTDAEIAAEGDKRTQEELLSAIQGKIDTALATRVSKEELKVIADAQKEALKDVPLDALRAMADDKTGVMAEMSKLSMELTRLKATMAVEKVDMSVRGQIAKWQTDNKDAIAKIKSGVKAELPELNIRLVASPMSVATVNVGNSPYIGRVESEGGLNEFIRAVPSFWDFIVKGRTNSPTYTWVNQTNPEGAAAFIGPGIAKPGISFQLVADISNAKKVADSAKATTELLDDIDGMKTFIEQELRYQVMIKVNSTLMNSVGTSTVPTGIRQLSGLYTLTTIKTISPNNMDAVRAVIGQLRSGFLQGDITVFINSVDAANMDLAKAVGGVYLLPPFVTSDGRTISGARIIEDNNVAVGFLQAGFMRYYRVLIYKDFTATWGWENDDFTKNLVTAVGEMRLHQFFNQIHTGAFIYDSFANIKTAITQV